MRFMEWAKDGGPDSPVEGFFLIEIKPLFSIVLLKFNKGARDKFHSHAFNALTVFLNGDMEEVEPTVCRPYKRLSIKLTKRSMLHRVVAHRDSWCISLRGPWAETWTEWDDKTDTTVRFADGRRIVGETS